MIENATWKIDVKSVSAPFQVWLHLTIDDQQAIACIADPAELAAAMTEACAVAEAGKEQRVIAEGYLGDAAIIDKDS